MTTQPRLTDRTALARFRQRASDPFLHNLARDEAQDRLSSVNRAFTKVAIVTPAPDIWADAFPAARLIVDDPVLDLPEGQFDLVINAMCLHWADDPVGQLIQCRRGLKPDGLLVSISPGGLTLNELRATLGQAEIELTGGLSPRFLPMGDIRDLGGLLQRAGLAMPVADSVTLTLTYRDIWRLMRDIRSWGEGNALADRRRAPVPRALFDRAAELYAQAFPTDDGRVSATLELVTLTGWAPAPDQPKPLRPGSAITRLADSLNTTETKLPD